MTSDGVSSHFSPAFNGEHLQRPARENKSGRTIDEGRELTNALTIDVEDYFQVEAFKSVVDRESWDSRTARVADNTERVLDMLAEADVSATFFVLGWVAERYPAIVKRIVADRHEVASHGYGHDNLRSLSPEQFRHDVHRAKSILEDVAGTRVRGYRAPTFSVGVDNWWVYDILQEEGHDYSSSVYPVVHDLYGMPQAPRTVFHPVRGSRFLEIPIATVRLLGKNRPCGGGGFFRLFPYKISQWSIERANRVDHLPCVFYCHPWEFDVDQPRLREASLKSRFRHYLNIGLMHGRMSRLLRDFAWGRMDQIFLGREGYMRSPAMSAEGL